MIHITRNIIHLLTMLLAVLLGSGNSNAAEDYPTRTVTIVVPFAAGGPADLLARQLASKFSEQLGQPFVVQNVSGAGTTVGTGRVVRSSPDGYTLLLNNLAISSNVSLYPELPFHPEKDLTTVGFINHSALVLVGRPTLPATSLSELTAWMKKNRARVGHTGTGSTAHLASTIFAQVLGTEVDHIPYRGGAPALQDVMGGQIDLTWIAAQAAEPVRENLVRGFGVTSRTRMDRLPQVPALATEIDERLEIPFWHGLFAPANTPPSVIERLNAALQQILSDTEMIQTWARSGVQPYPSDQRSPEAGHKILTNEIKRWGEVIREHKIAPQR